MKKFKAFSDVVLGSSFDNDGSTWHGYILSTKQWAQIFFQSLFFQALLLFNDSFELRDMGERKQYHYSFCFSFIKK